VMEEALGGIHIPRFTEHRIDEVAVGVDRPVEIAPASIYLHIRAG